MSELKTEGKVEKRNSKKLGRMGAGRSITRGGGGTGKRVRRTKATLGRKRNDLP